MEDRPSKLHISVSSIKELELTEGEIKVVKKQSEQKRSSNSVKVKKSHDEISAKKQANTSPEREVRRTSSLSVSKKTSNPSATVIRKSASSESADKKGSHTTVQTGKKRSSSVEEQAKIQPQTKAKDSKSKSKQGTALKINEVSNQSPEVSTEKVVTQKLTEGITKWSSSTEQYKQSSVVPKDLNSKSNIKAKNSGDVNYSKAIPRKSISAGTESKPEYAQITRKQGTTSSAPAGREQHRQANGFSTVKKSKSKQTTDRRPSSPTGLPNSLSPQDASSKSPEHAERARRPSVTSHPSDPSRQHKEPDSVSKPAPFSDTPFPFHNTKHRTKKDSDSITDWTEQVLETPTPWGGLDSEAAAMLVVTTSGITVPTGRRSSSTAATKQRGATKGQRGSKRENQRRSLDLQKSSTGDEEQQCLSLSVAQAVADEHKRSFVTVLDDDALEQLRVRAAELNSREIQDNTLGYADKTESHAQLQESRRSSANTNRSASGKRVTSVTSISAGGKGFKGKRDENLKEKMSGDYVSKQDSEESQSKLITLENPFKKNKASKEEEGGEMKNVFASALLDKWMTDGARDHSKSSSSKNVKQSDPKSKKHGLPKQLLGSKKPTSTKEKVLHTITEKRINLLIPQSLPDPSIISHADQVPAVGVSPIDIIQDSEAGRSQGADSRQIQEEFFTSPDSYRSSIAQAQLQMARRPAPGLTSSKVAPSIKHAAATSTEPTEDSVSKKTSKEEDDKEKGTVDQEEPTLADAMLEEQAARSDWVTSSSSEVTLVGSDGKISRRRKSALRRKRLSSAQKYYKWKRKASNKAYIEYQLRTRRHFHAEDDDMSQSTSLSLYPATSSEAVTADVEPSWSDTSSVQTAQRPGADTDQGTPKSMTRATSTDKPGRTEGTQTSSTEYLLLDRRSCLVKVLAALQRLNTDEALQVARILRRSLDQGRVYEDTSVKQILGPKIDAKPLPRVESEKVMPKGSASRSAVIFDTIPDQDYDELMRIVSQIDLMVRSKVRITAAPYSLIYETLINYHLEITQDYSPSVAVFNYYLTEQGHPLFEDTSGFFRPTILQVARESLYPRLYAHKPDEEPRELPAGGRLLDLQLLLDELLICPFCGQDVIWGQNIMCVKFCCDSFAEVISHEYEDDLGRIRRQAALRQQRAELGELEEDAELLEAALGAASSEQQPPAKLHCDVERRSRLQQLRAYGQAGTVTDKVPQLLPFDIDMVKKASTPKAADERKEGRRRSRKSRRKSSQPAGQDAARKKSATRRHSRRHASQPHKRPRTKRISNFDDGAAGDESPPASKRGSRSKKRSSTKRDLGQEVEKLEKKMGRRLTKDELEVIMEAESVMRSDARGLSITAGGIEKKLDVTSLENIPDRGPSRRRSPRASREFILDTLGIKLSRFMHDADGETTDTESTVPSRKRGKGRAARRARHKTRAAREREAEASAIALDAADGSSTKRADRTERDSVSVDDQLHYRLSESAFLEEGLTQLPWDPVEDDTGGATEPLPKLVTHPVESGQRRFLQERYPDGALFVTWFDDGSGHVMYPSGEPALLITVEPAGRRFVVLPDQPCTQLTSSTCVLAMFDPRGIGFVYSTKGTPRLLLDQHEGWYHRDDGTVRRWRWSDLDDHVNHSPTLQPVMFAISRHVAIRVMRQDYIVLSFWANQRSARFNVGVTAEPASTKPATGGWPESSDRFRIVYQPSEHQELVELRDRVRHILGDMARLTDEPVKYLIHHQKLMQRACSVPLRQPAPRWLAAEPRQPQLPGGASAALGRRSAGSSARRALLLQQMALLSSHVQPVSVERRGTSVGGQPTTPPTLPGLSAPLSGLLTAPTEVT